MRSICTRLGEAREEIVSQQSQKREETYSEIVNYSLNTTTKTVPNTIATQIATNVYESGQYWYAYGGNGLTKLPDMKDSNAFPKFTEKEYQRTVKY